MLIKISLGYIFLLVMFMLITCISGKSLSYKQCRRALTLLLFSFSILAYFTAANSWDGNDLGRYLLSMDEYKERGLHYVLTHGMWKQTPLASIEMYLFALLGNNHLLPAFNTLVVWGIYFHILQVESIDEGFVTSRKFFACLIGMVATVNLFESISNVRYPVAAALFILGLYLDFYGKRRKTNLILYVAACLIHVAIIPLVIVRFCLKIPFFRKNRWIIVILIAVTFGFISSFLLSSQNEFLSYLGEKTEGYSGKITTYGLLYSLGAMCRYLGAFSIELSGMETGNADDIDKGIETYDEINRGIGLFGLTFLFLAPSLTYRMTPLVFCGALHSLKYTKNYALLRIGIIILIVGIIIGLYYNAVNYYIPWTFWE